MSIHHSQQNIPHKKINKLIIKTLQTPSYKKFTTKKLNTLPTFQNHKSNNYINSNYSQYSHLYSLNTKQLINLHKLLKLILKHHLITSSTYYNITSQSEEILSNYQSFGE